MSALQKLSLVLLKIPDQMILIFGGKKDPHIIGITKTAMSMDIPVEYIHLEKNKIPSIIWDLGSDRLLINEKEILPKGVFMRNDVFNSIPESSQTGYSWFTTLRSWVLAHPNVQMYNRHYIGMHKSYNLAVAKKIGFDIPHTLVTNQITTLRHLPHTDQYIVKPVTGGAYTLTLEDFLSEKKDFRPSNTSLVYLQNKLVPPEMRIFGIKNEFFAFQLKSDQLDYRTDKRTKIVRVEPPALLTQKLAALMDAIKLDFCAADFKTCPRTGKYLFLEANSGPMFKAFDIQCDHAISKALIGGLMSS